MGSSSSKSDKTEATSKKEEQKDGTEKLEEINIIVEKSEEEVIEEKKKNEEEERLKKEEEERKREEFKQSVLQKINEDELIIKISLTSEEFTTYIIKFFEEFIQVYYSLQKKNSFIQLILQFNKKYIYTFNNIDYPENPLKEDFFEILKYSTIIVVCLVFISKDSDLYKKYWSKVREPVEKFIYSIINIVGRNSLKTKIINTFVKNFKKQKRGPIFCINDVIKLLFSTGKYVNAYKNLKNALNQIIENLETETIEEVIEKINESVLFFYNASNYVIGTHNPKSTIIKKETTTISTNANTIRNTKKKSLSKTNTKKRNEEKKVEEKKSKRKRSSNYSN